METIIGFAAGYLVGAKDGRAGAHRLMASIEAIVRSPETRRLAGQARSFAGAMMRQTSARGISAGANGVAEHVLRRASEATLTRRHT